MADGQIDRAAFVKKDKPKKPRGSSKGIVALFFVAVVAVIAYAGYQYVEANGMPVEIAEAAPEFLSQAVADMADATAVTEEPPADLDQVVSRLEKIEKRLRRLEKRRGGAAVKVAATKQDSVPKTVVKAPAEQESPAARAADSAKSTEKIAETTAATKTGDEQVGTVASQDGWKATSDRLVDTVGELSSQGSKIDQNSENLQKLLDRYDRSQITFNLSKRDGKRQVGPVWLRLRAADSRNQRYTVHLHTQDKRIELKDRVLGEPVEVFLSGNGTPIELLVSEIGKDRIVGTLAVPQGK